MLQIIEKVPEFLSKQYADMVTPCISARSVHHYLGVKTKFNDWIKRRIDEYDFKEGLDFTLLKNENGELYSFQQI